MKTLLKKTYEIFAATACILILSGSSCENEKKSELIKKPKKTVYKNNDSDIRQKQQYNYSNDTDDIAFLDDLSTQKSTDIELEIKKLIAMLDKEESLLERNVPSEPYQTVLFDKSSDDLGIDQKELIQKMVKKIAKVAKNGKRVIIRGHCDLLETDNENAFALAEKRATSVKDELIKLNIPSDKIEISSVGSSEPVVFGFNSEAQDLENLANRRVEIWTT